MVWRRRKDRAGSEAPAGPKSDRQQGAITRGRFDAGALVGIDGGAWVGARPRESRSTRLCPAFSPQLNVMPLGRPGPIVRTPSGALNLWRAAFAITIPP